MRRTGLALLAVAALAAGGCDVSVSEEEPDRASAPTRTVTVEQTVEAAEEPATEPQDEGRGDVIPPDQDQPASDDGGACTSKTISAADRAGLGAAYQGNDPDGEAEEGTVFYGQCGSTEYAEATFATVGAGNELATFSRTASGTGEWVPGGGGGSGAPIGCPPDIPLELVEAWHGKAQAAEFCAG